MIFFTLPKEKPPKEKKTEIVLTEKKEEKKEIKKEKPPKPPKNYYQPPNGEVDWATVGLIIKDGQGKDKAAGIGAFPLAPAPKK